MQRVMLEFCSTKTFGAVIRKKRFLFLRLSVITVFWIYVFVVVKQMGALLVRVYGLRGKAQA